VLECVVNISEGARLDVVEHLCSLVAPVLLDVHTDGDHNRSVLTLVGEDGPRSLTRAAVAALDLRDHVGVHPRIGVVDVVPFVPLGDATLADADAAADRFARWAAAELDVPCFRYGSGRSLPAVRRGAFTDFGPDWGPSVPHPSAGAIAVGARPVLVAYNLWLTGADLDAARAIARDLRGPAVRALGLAVGDEVQVSMNLIDPMALGPAQVYDAVATRASVARAELVGLVPRAVLEATEVDRWPQLDLSEERTIEARLATRGLQLE